jgi:hypothetical protein
MRRHSLLAISVFISVLFSCCNNNERHVSVKGQIIDDLTGKPIAKAEVVVLCWYYYGLDEATYREQKLETDEKGNFAANFNEGYQVDVASKAPGYLPGRAFNELSSNRLVVNLELAKERTNPSLKAYILTDGHPYEDTDSTPFLRVRYSYDKSGKLAAIETFGIAFDGLKTSKDTSKCDIWFRPPEKEGHPAVVVANTRGGIIPVYSHEISSSFYYEKPMAPTTAYSGLYTLQGNEEGLFVLCRDGRTYAKLMLEKSALDVSSPDGKGGSFKEYGKHFSCIYQPNGTNDLSYSASSINLRDFLLDWRIR